MQGTTRVAEHTLPTHEELAESPFQTLVQYRRAVGHELQRAKRRGRTGTRRSLQARIVADVILESILSEHLRIVDDILAVKRNGY